MNISNRNVNIRTNLYAFSKERMRTWIRLNNLPEYLSASYTGHTGVKEYLFPTNLKRALINSPDITKDLQLFEEEVLQEIKDTRRKPFGWMRVLWKMCKNFGTAEIWDTKFLPQFPGRSIDGQKQYARYKNEVISGNDLSNRFYGHVCAYMGIPLKLAQLAAKFDACGILEPLSKGKFPNKTLRKFRDPESDQLAIKLGMQEFNINDYRLR